MLPPTRFLLVLAVALVASLYGCEAAGHELIASNATATVAVEAVLPATAAVAVEPVLQLLLPETLEIPATLEVPADTAELGVETAETAETAELGLETAETAETAELGLETAATAETATATHGKKFKDWSKSSKNSKNWSKNWSKNKPTRRSVTITQFWQNNVWYSAWLNSLTRAVEVATIVPSMSTLLAAVTAAGVAGPLADKSISWTILAPTNDAFDDLLEALGVSAAELLANTELLTTVLSYHVVPAAALTSNQLQEVAYNTALAGQAVTVDKRPSGGVGITGGSPQNVATVIVPNIRAGRSIIHVIDTVLVPSA